MKKDLSSDPRGANWSINYWYVLPTGKLTIVYSCIKTDCYVSGYVNHIHLVYFINCNWDTDPNKSDDFLLDPFCIYNKYAMFWFVFSVKNYTNKILFKLMTPRGNAMTPRGNANKLRQAVRKPQEKERPFASRRSQATRERKAVRKPPFASHKRKKSNKRKKSKANSPLFPDEVITMLNRIH